MSFYLSVANDKLKHPSDNPTIGLLICKSKSKVVAEYSLKGLRKPIGVTDYQLSSMLPDKYKESLPSTTELENAMALDNRNKLNRT